MRQKHYLLGLLGLIAPCVILSACTSALDTSGQSSQAQNSQTTENIPSTEKNASNERAPEPPSTAPSKEAASPNEPSPAPPLSTENEQLTVKAEELAPSNLSCFLLYAYDPADTSVNMRDRPDGDIIRTLPNRTPLSREGPASIDPEWNRIYDTEQETWGYIWGDLLKRTHYQIQDTQDTSANLRDTPNGNIVTALPNGTIVAFLGIEDSWTQVQTENGQEGYISTALLVPPDCF